MTITGRAVLLALLGMVPAALEPGWPTLLGWWALWILAVGVDVLLAGSPRGIAVERAPLPSVRLGELIEAPYVLANHGRRRVRGLVRDGWQPSAGARADRARLDLPGGQRRRLVTTLCPTRRGDAGWSTSPSAASDRSRSPAVNCPPPPAPVLPPPPAQALPMFSGCGSWTADQPAVRGQEPSSTAARLRIGVTCGRSTGGHRPALPGRVAPGGRNGPAGAARAGPPGPPRPGSGTPRLDAAMDAALLLAAPRAVTGRPAGDGPVGARVEAPRDRPAARWSSDGARGGPRGGRLTAIVSAVGAG